MKIMKPRSCNEEIKRVGFLQGKGRLKRQSDCEFSAFLRAMNRGNVEKSSSHYVTATFPHRQVDCCLKNRRWSAKRCPCDTTSKTFPLRSLSTYISGNSAAAFVSIFNDWVAHGHWMPILGLAAISLSSKLRARRSAESAFTASARAHAAPIISP